VAVQPSDLHVMADQVSFFGNRSTIFGICTCIHT
jgi:hypothetical protein